MAEKLLMLEQVNLFMGDHDPEASNHIKLQSMTLPTIEQVTVSHLGGGAVMEVEWGVNAVRPLSPTFKLAGFSRDSYRMIGIGSNRVEPYTAYGVLRNKMTATQHQAKAVWRGIASRLAPDAFDRSSAFGHDHTIAEVTHYELIVDGEEWFYVDLFENVRRRFGTDELAGARVALGIV